MRTRRTGGIPVLVASAALVGTAAIGAAAEGAEPAQVMQLDAASGNDAAVVTRFDAALRRAEDALASGEPERAAELFGLASHLVGESAVAELGMVRAYMHNGEYRKALSYGNLATIEHKDSTAAYAFLAYLVDRSGSPERALEGLREARARAPDDVALLGAQAEILIDRRDSETALREIETWRARNDPQQDIERLYARALRSTGRSPESDAQRPMQRARAPSADDPSLAAAEARWSQRWPHPYQAKLPLPDGAKVETASGALVDSGKRVATLASIVAHARRIWIRTSRGTVRGAQVESVSDSTGVATLVMDEAIAEPGGEQPLAWASPAPGSPCYVVGFLSNGSPQPGWPALSAGLHGNWHGQAGDAVAASIALTPGQFGGPAFDRYGRLIGIAGPARSSREAEASGKILVRPIDIGLPQSKQGARAPSTAAAQQEIYERGFGVAVLVIVQTD